ncbi:4-hydroxy-3-methylbut-2-enyl diphosphate reductase [candidate division GN15 bacterium]|nr:4-hydroxy-3-methylbut-2-enyl diphosphate reductase [candidate division GN15 bacterium]
MIKKIIIARSYGFCMGVKRAIKIAEETAETTEGPVTILNEIVHNHAVVEDFRNKGIGQKFKVDDVEGGTLIISAHGVSPDVKTAAKEKGLQVVDATCPLVSRIYDIIQDVVPKDYHIIHFGDRNHDETTGVVGHAPERITVISSPDELGQYPAWEDRKLGLTVQTTMGLEDFVEFQKAAVEKWPHIEVFDTICNATNKRQTAIMDMASEVDMVLVVGSETSANSNRLAGISRMLCGRGELIGNEFDIKKEWFTGDNESVERVGISAGASTPDFLVDSVIRKLQRLSDGKAEVVTQEKKRRKRARRAAS